MKLDYNLDFKIKLTVIPSRDGNVGFVFWYLPNKKIRI